MLLVCLLIALLHPLSALKFAHITNESFNRTIGKYGVETTYFLDSNVFYIVEFPDNETKFPFRITTYSNGCKAENPIMIVVRQRTQVNSWQLPLIEETTNKIPLAFNEIGRTMCPDFMDSSINSDFWSGPLMNSQSFLITMSSSKPAIPGKPGVDVTLKVEQETNFYIQNDITYSLTISPSDPRYYYYEFSKNSSDTIVIELDSDDDICLTVSVQDATCPVLQNNKDVTYEGKHQTLNRKGALTVRKKDFTKGFFLVFVVKTDNYDCSEKNSVLPNPRSRETSLTNRTSVITYKITNSINSKDYLIVSLGTFFLFIIFGILCTVMICISNRFGTISKYCSDIVDHEADGESIDQTGPITRPQIDGLIQTQKLTVKSLAMYPKRDKRRSFNYLWHILSIAIFYSIPVVQLVVTYQRVVNQTGNQDMCYYNFRCAHPSFGFSDFNHIYSNIGYVITGIIFIFVTINRHSKIEIRLEVGIPVHYGLFYAMGVALIIEGVLSACYHICPSQSNYQFDTSFMYVMAVLCMVKLYQNRHPDINATAYATFTVLGIAIFLAMLGILNGSLPVWICFVVIYSMLCVYISFKIYYLSFVLQGFQRLKSDYDENGFTKEIFAPVKKSRFILLVISNLVNYAMLITGLCLYSSEVTDFGTFLLGLLMANSVIYAIFYTMMKIINREKVCVEAIIYGLLGVVSWAAATVFFLDASTLWTVTPAESRQWNQDCLVLDFYDKHDVWHLLSAPALYFSFMFLMCLDDDLINVKQNEISVF